MLNQYLRHSAPSTIPQTIPQGCYAIHTQGQLIYFSDQANKHTAINKVNECSKLFPRERAAYFFSTLKLQWKKLVKLVHIEKSWYASSQQCKIFITWPKTDICVLGDSQQRTAELADLRLLLNLIMSGVALLFLDKWSTNIIV